LENREIAKNYSALYKQLEFVNFSLDVNRKEWEAAAKVDGIVWYNVSDMAGMAGKIKTLYDVQAMPTSFLIDRNGLIVDRFDGYSSENIIKVAKIVSGEK
jgi:thioredoxin-related protein